MISKANFAISDGVGGMARLDAVCIPYNDPQHAHVNAATVEDWNSTHPTSAIGRFLSHELGHIIGMMHNHGWGNNYGHTDISLCELDFDDKEKGLVNIMRQLEPSHRRVWSICNRCDLLKSYQNQMKTYGKYCMEDNVSNSGTPGSTNDNGPSGPSGPSDSSEEYIDDSTTLQPGSSDEFTEETVDPNDTNSGTTLFPDTNENEHIPKPTEEIDLTHCAMELKGNIKNMIPPKLTFRITVITLSFTIYLVILKLYFRQHMRIVSWNLSIMIKVQLKIIFKLQ